MSARVAGVTSGENMLTIHVTAATAMRQMKRIVNELGMPRFFFFLVASAMGILSFYLAIHCIVRSSYEARAFRYSRALFAKSAVPRQNTSSSNCTPG